MMFRAKIQPKDQKRVLQVLIVAIEELWRRKIVSKF